MRAMKHLFILTGASRGMGRAMAQQLLAPQHHLLCLSRQSDAALQADATSAQCALEQWRLDLADAPTAAARLGAWLEGQGSGGWAGATLINNAGVIPAIAPLRDQAADAGALLAAALRVGLEAPMLLTAAFLRGTGGWGVPRRVLNISSGLGRRAMGSQAAYCAAKAGMDHFTRCLALEEAGRPNGARVCSLAPGVIDTDMQVQLRGAPDALFPDRGNFAALKDKGQLTSPEAAAQRVLAWLDRPDFGDQPVVDVRDA